MNFSQFHTEPFMLKVSKGKVNGHHIEHKFGAVPSMAVNTTGSIWDVSDTFYPWASFGSGVQLTIPAVASADDGLEVVLSGLDVNYKPITENIVVSSSTSTTTTKTFLRVFRGVVTGDTSNDSNINVQAAGTTVLRITAGLGQTLMAVYTVPAGYTAYLSHLDCTIKYGGDATIDFFVREQNEPFRIKHTIEIASGSSYSLDFIGSIKLPEKSDVDLRATMRSNNARVTANFTMVLSENLYMNLER